MTATRLEFFGGSKGQAALALEKLFQSPVAGTALAADDPGRNELAQFTTKASSFQPVFIADRAFNRNAGDF